MHPKHSLTHALLAALALLPLTASSQTWPDKPITLVVAFAPGGTADIVGRIVAAQLSKQLGQQVIVENKPGAGATIAATAVARAKPDGYTMLQMVSSHATGETLYKNRGYDAMKDLAPISVVATSPYFVLVNPEKTKAATMQDFAAEIRANPGKFSYAHGGSGAIAHLASEMMKAQGKLDMVSVGFKGNSPAATEVLAGRIDMVIDQPASADAFIKAGKLKALAVTSKERIATAPNVPTMNESGFPGYEAMSWFGLAFPKATPREIVERMSSEVAKAMASPEVRSKFEGAGLTPASSTPAQFTSFFESEIGRWRKVINDAKITTD